MVSWFMLRPFSLPLALACVIAAGCQSIKREDVRPGGTVVMEDKAISWMSDLSGNPAGHHGWVFVKVIAPPGAKECRVVGSLFDGVNPYEKGRVDADGAVLLTVRKEQAKQTFACRTPAGETRRTIASERVTNTFKDYKQRPYTRSYWSTPPLAHMDPSDPQAPARWDAMHAEYCTGAKLSRVGVCAGERFANMKARDLEQ
jgi:hypothetical protein